MTGAEAEKVAEDYLVKEKNHQVLERNFKVYEGEIDIISQDRDILVFIEVKYLKNSWQYDPEEQVHSSKQKKLFKAAQAYLQLKKYSGECRFDVLSINGENGKLEFAHFVDALEFNS
jgi:putative endonuclease